VIPGPEIGLGAIICFTSLLYWCGFVPAVDVGDCEAALEHGFDDLERAHSDVGVEGGACKHGVIACWEAGGEDGWVVGEGEEFVGDDFLDGGGVDWDDEPCCLC
jgi:hypothetical protein